MHIETGYAAGTCTSNKLAATQKRVAAVMKADTPKESNSWEKLKKAFDGNRGCMAVYEAYDFGEAIRHLMTNHWDQIGKLEKYMKSDSNFFQFVISGLKDETANAEDLKKIQTLAQTKCPQGAEAICKEVVDNVKITP